MTFSSGEITGYSIDPDASYPTDLYDAHVMPLRSTVSTSY
jgi:hypothetical protein